LIVEIDKVHGVLVRVIDVVDPDPDPNKRLGFVDELREDRVAVLCELQCLVYQARRVVVVERRIGCRDVGACEGEVPELFGAGAWVCEAGFETAAC